MNFSQNNETTSFQSQTQNRQLESFKEESNESMGFNQISSSSIQSASSIQSKSSIHSSSINSSSSQQVSSSKQFSSSAMSMSSQQKTESSKAVTSSLSDMFQQVKTIYNIYSTDENIFCRIFSMCRKAKLFTIRKSSKMH